MENNNDNKARFFALYYGQTVLNIGAVNNVTIGRGNWNLRHPDFYLELKPLSSITDEDAIEISMILVTGYEIGCERNTIDNALDFISRFKHDIGKENFYSAIEWGNTIDFLRSKGYALPFLGLSVETLEKYGWIKLLNI